MGAADTWLTPEEVETLTAKQRWSAQCRALAKMGKPFEPNAVGRPLVPRSAIVGGDAGKPERKREPNWSAIGGKAA